MAGIRYRVLACPHAQPRHRVGLGRAYLKKSHPVHAYKRAVEIYTMQNLRRPFTGALALWLTFVLPRPQAAPKWCPGWLWNLGSKVGRDLDNFEKSTMDALNKLAYEDDSQVVWKLSRKVTAGAGEEPYAEIWIQPIVTDPDPHKIVIDFIPQEET